MISNRLKLARQANCYSLQDLSDILSRKSLSITRATLSNYETGRIQPTEKTLFAISRALGVTRSFFDKAEWSDFTLQLRHCCEFQTEKRRQELLSYLQIELERYLSINSILGIHSAWVSPEQTEVDDSGIDKIEEIVSYARAFLHAGSAQVASVCTLLENNGWYLLFLPLFFEDLENFTGIEASHNMPFITYKVRTHPDDFRLQLLKELGYFFVCSSDRFKQEEYVSRFARAFLLPRETVMNEFGHCRTKISYSELTLAKQRYGLGRIEILKRLVELKVITDDYFDEFYAYIDQHSFISRESALSDAGYFFEAPVSYRNKVWRAYSEGLIDYESEHVLPEWNR